MLEMAVIIAVLVGLGQLMKGLGVPAKYVPLINVILGIAIGLLGGAGADLTILEQVLGGAIIGLSASGLYDQKKITRK